MAAQIRALVSVKWLADAVKNKRVGPNLRVLDTSWYLPKLKRQPKKEFRERHIPGASFFDIDKCSDNTSPFDHMMPGECEFGEFVGNLGIGTGTHVVVYDASEFGSFSAPRVWWMFRAFGHGSVSVLDGGLKAWVREGYQLTGEYTKPEPVEFRAKLDRSRVKSYQDVLENLESKRFQLVDARSVGRFRGIEPEPRDNTEPGHIPGSVSMPFPGFLSQSGEEKDPDQLREMFRKAGVDLSRPLCATCGSGVTACHVALAAFLCGQEEVAIYDGAWSEWYTRATPEHVISEGRGKHL
ncbi:3-mercaptopyruvate sulfurtransferase [Acipenser ruthenus]|uniref:3-mercaptopyruvate sulfurtransferase n=1 Tax=Acipenser ruthenus TaxID=7906 RepID=UPI0027429475|nr:3-mercaptopyruvate sulfurtransferase [Acipenser ruthenus]